MSLYSPLKHRIINILQSIFIILGLGLILVAVSWFFAGTFGLILVCLVWFISIIVIPNISPHIILSMYPSVPLEPYQTPELYKIVRELSDRANLKTMPTLHYIRSQNINAFTTGSGENTAIALSDGLLRILDYDELIAIIAHEIAHVKNNDIWIMQIADITSRLITILSYMGQLILILLIPLFLIENLVVIAVFLSVVILSFPIVNILLQLSLNRVREYDADVVSALLTGNPRALATALYKLYSIEQRWYSYFNPFAKNQEPSVLRTHPPLKSRIEKLIELEHDKSISNIQPITAQAEHPLPHSIPIVKIIPKKRFTGLYW